MFGFASWSRSICRPSSISSFFKIRLPPSAPGPREGGRWLRPAAAPGLRPARYAVASPPGTQAPGYAGLGLTPPSRRPSLRRRPGPPPPTRGATPRLRSRRGTRSWGSPLGGSGWTWRSALRASAGSPRPFCAPSRRVPPGRPRPRPALPRPSVGWSPGRATGSAPPAWGLLRPGGPLSPATGPRRRGRCRGRGRILYQAGADRGSFILCQLCQVILLTPIEIFL